MNKLQRVSGLLVAFSLFAPALAMAQVTGSSTVDVQIQSLLSQITSLEQQLKSLVQSVAPSSTPMMWEASSTPPAMSDSGMGGCPDFTRDLSLGAQGSDVMQLQQMLEGDGFFSASTTGFFGPLTASALNEFQLHFGISTSSAGLRFVQSHCGEGMMGSSTHMMSEQSRTPPPPPQSGEWMASSTNDHMMGPMGSSTHPYPCPPQNSAQGAAAALFVPHVILPAFMFDPCNATSSPTQ